MDPIIQDRADRIVAQEVQVCVSGLVHTLAQGYGAVDGSRGAIAHGNLSDLTEQAMELSSPVPDYEEAAIQAGWKPFPVGWWNSNRFVSPSSAYDARMEQDFDAVQDTAEDVCEHLRIDPYDQEVYEHWAVSDWLADKLEAKGEKIERDFAGLIVWARTTTGQAISMDAVIQEIAEG